MNLVSVAVLAVILFYAVRHSLMFEGTEFDDAYITYRHADNLARFNGPVYNAGEHVEGTSTFLFTCVLAVPARCGADLTVVAPKIGIASFLFLIVLTYCTVRLLVRGTPGQVLGLGAAALVASNTSLAYYSMTGMETTFYASLLLLGLHFLFKNALDGSAPRAWPAVMAFASMSRPEGLIFFGMLFSVDTAFALGRAASVRKWIIGAAKTLGVFAAIFGPFLVFRLLFYGDWVPNTVLAKSGPMDGLRHVPVGQARDLIIAGIGYARFKQWLELLGLGVFLLVPGLLVARTRFANVVVLLVLVACACVLVWNEGDWMPFYRLLTPAMAPVAVCIATGLHAVLFNQAVKGRLVGHLFSYVLSLLVLGAVADRMFFQRSYSFPHTQVTNWMKTIGMVLGAQRRDDDVLVTDMAGIIPYYSRVHTIDHNGLCDRYIATHGAPIGPMGKIEWDYCIRKNPTYYQFNNVGVMHQLYTHPSFALQKDEYCVLHNREYLAIQTSDRKALVIRKDRPHLDQLLEAFGGTCVDIPVELKRLGLTY